VAGGSYVQSLRTQSRIRCFASRSALSWFSLLLLDVTAAAAEEEEDDEEGDDV
jgi:hypothetical protein